MLGKFVSSNTHIRGAKSMEKYAELKSLIEKIYRRAEDKAVCFSYSEPANLKTPRRWVGKLFPVVTEIEVNVSEVWAFEAGIRGLTVKRLLRKAGHEFQPQR